VNTQAINQRDFTDGGYYDTMGRKAPKVNPDSLIEDLSGSVLASTQAGSVLFILDNKSKVTRFYDGLYVTSISYSFKEKAQLVETFKVPNISFFGETARIYNISGLCLSHPSYTDDGKIDLSTMHQSILTELYHTVMRGTQLVKSKSVAVLRIFNHMIKGYPLSLNISESSSLDKLTQFSMT